jgi:ADP-ribose pyrophosphatase
MADVPISLLARKEVFRNAVFTVYADHIRDATGNEVPGYLTVVPHHRTSDGVTGVAVLPVLDGKFCLIRVYRHSIGAYGWEVARGFVDQAETPPAAAQRELAEETGLVATAGSLRDLGTLAPEPGVLQARVRLFAAEGCVPAGAARGREIGHHETGYFTRREFIGLADRGEIVDPCSLVCFYRYIGLPA